MIFQEREALPRKTPKSVRLQSLQVLGCTPQAFKPSTCPVSRLKKEPRVSDRDINALKDGDLPCLRQGLEWHPTIWGRRQAGHGSSLCSQGRERLQLQGKLKSGWLISCQGNQQRGAPLTASLINYHSGDSSHLKSRPNTSWGQGQVHGHLLIKLYDEEGSSARWVGADEAGTRRARDVQRAREQPSWVAWPYSRESKEQPKINRWDIIIKCQMKLRRWITDVLENQTQKFLPGSTQTKNPCASCLAGSRSTGSMRFWL